MNVWTSAIFSAPPGWFSAKATASATGNTTGFAVIGGTVPLISAKVEDDNAALEEVA